MSLPVWRRNQVAKALLRRLREEAWPRERDEARAEVATAAKYCDELAETIRMHVAREIELEAEVEMLRGVDCCANGDGPCGVCRKCAYRRGAEAMREACAREAFDYMDAGNNWPAAIVRDILRALPIPEDKP